MVGIRKSMGVDSVDDMLDDIREEMDLLHEVNNTFSQPIDPFGCDDDELLAELDALEVDSMPAAPAKTPSLWSSRPAMAPAKVNKPQSSRIALFA
jgi:hypothetical protein